MMRSVLLMAVLAVAAPVAAAEGLDLSRAVVVTRGDRASRVERTAATVLVEEVEKRTGLRWKIAAELASEAPVIVVTASPDGATWSPSVPKSVRDGLATLRPEGYQVLSEVGGKRPVVWAVGVDDRGALYGVGHLLRTFDMTSGSVRLRSPLDVAHAPAYPLRGHQLGYRARANSYDAWDARQYEQYIRELAIFGANAVENIPFEDRQASPHMKLTRRDMNRALGDICLRYGLQHWVWTPADFDLTDAARRRQALADHEQLYADCARLDGVFVPGGDPGNNPPELVIPFLQDLAERLQRVHPQAKVWLSLQYFDPPKVDAVYAWLEREQPAWLGGLVHAPSSPDLAETRRRLPARYALRHYPDITHAVRCQYPVPWWDPAFACTLGRESINPTPTYQVQIHNALAPYTNGFLSYSDGAHDDVNKIVWTQLACDPQADVRNILIDYARFFFETDVAEPAADGILALERNWQGPLRTNGGVDATLALWRGLESRALPSRLKLGENWRWQMCLLRAYYDADVRHRLIDESRLEDEANAELAKAPARGADAAMAAALAVLKRAETDRQRPELRARIEELCEALFRSIGLQTSVAKYQASGAERGAVLDYLDYPLNNRWWLEDQFAEIRQLPDEAEKQARLELIRTWEHPGPGSFYDDVGNVAKSPHVLRGETPDTDPKMLRNENPGHWEGGRKRARQSWFSNMDWPIGLRYDGLDPSAAYTIRTTGFGECLLRIDGERVRPSRDGKDIGEFKEFPVPQRLLADGALLLTFDIPQEQHLNWRQRSRLTELWLLRQ